MFDLGRFRWTRVSEVDRKLEDTRRARGCNTSQSVLCFSVSHTLRLSVSPPRGSGGQRVGGTD